MELKSLISEYQTLTKRLIEAFLQETSPPNVLLSRTSSGTVSSEAMMQALLKKDTELQAAIERLIEHQNFQKQVFELKKQIEEKEGMIQEMVTELRQIEKMLMVYVEEGRKQVQRIERSEEGALPAQEMVSYAHRISYTTGPNWESKLQSQTMNPIDLGFQPPAPKEDEMRSGLLYTTPKSSLFDEIKK